MGERGEGGGGGWRSPKKEMNKGDEDSTEQSSNQHIVATDYYMATHPASSFTVVVSSSMSLQSLMNALNSLSHSSYSFLLLCSSFPLVSCSSAFCIAGSGLPSDATPSWLLPVASAAPPTVERADDVSADLSCCCDNSRFNCREQTRHSIS